MTPDYHSTTRERRCMTRNGNGHSPALLLVEDDADDQRIFQWALKKSGLLVDVRLAQDGEQAIRFLARSPQRPFLIVSDIHLPRRSGWEVLEWIRSQAALSMVPVLIWTSLPTPEGAEKAHQLGATSYFSKPTDAGGYRRLVDHISAYLRD
jgi:CheY-like chemotaxis protein